MVGSAGYRKIDAERGSWVARRKENGSKTYKAVVAVAHRYHVKVHAHLYEEAAVRDAFTAGVDILQHVSSAGSAPYDPKLVREIAESGRPVVPTEVPAWINIY